MPFSLGTLQDFRIDFRRMDGVRDAANQDSSEARARISVDLEAILRARMDDASVVVGVPERFGGGHSGFTYKIDVGRGGANSTAVLRLSPPNARIAGTADIGRQARIMRALAEAGLPAPGVFAHDSAPVVDDRSFGLFEHIDAVDWKTAAARSSHREVAKAALATIADIHKLAPERTGIGDETPFTPVEELGRWQPLLERSPAAVRDYGTKLLGELRVTAPAAYSGTGPSLTHGDYHFGNLLFGAGGVVAVIDWEIAALGEPLVDLGCLAVASIRRRYDPEPNHAGSIDVSVIELVELAGADPEQAKWHVAASCLKYAAILGYNRSLHESGRRPDEVYARLSGTMSGLLADGASILHGGLNGW